MEKVKLMSEMGIQVMAPNRILKPHLLKLEDMPNGDYYYHLAKIKNQSTGSTIPFWIIWLAVSLLIGILIK